MTRAIFVVDDSEIVLSVSRQILEKAGYRVITQSRAARCLSQIHLERPVLVLLDVNMPDLPGSGVSDLCRGAREAGAIVVLHSSLDVRSLRRLVTVSGADHFIQKTDNAALLVQQVSRLLGDRALPQVGAGSTTEQSDARWSGTHRKAGGTRQGNALLVDRDMASLSSMREIVQQMGLECEFALSLKQAMGKLESSRPPDAIVVSDEMPQSGLLRLFELAVALNPEWRNRFIIAASGDTRAQRPPGFSGPVVPRPITPTKLQAAIEQVLPVSVDSGSSSPRAKL